MRGLTHVIYQRQELSNTALGGLSHSKWIATKHCTSLFICLVREEVTQRFDAVNTEFL